MNRRKSKWTSKLQTHISSWIMHHFNWFFHQNDHQSKIYTNIIMNWRIDEIENQPLEEQHLWIALSKACNGPKLLYDACGDDWWKKWSSNARESSRFCKLHWTFKLRVWSKLARFDPSPRSNLLKNASASWINQKKCFWCEELQEKFERKVLVILWFRSEMLLMMENSYD